MFLLRIVTLFTSTCSCSNLGEAASRCKGTDGWSLLHGQGAAALGRVERAAAGGNKNVCC